MTTRAEQWAEFQRLFDADRLEQAEAVLDQIEPVSDEVWFESLRNAPMDDEPVTPCQQARIDALRAALARATKQAAG